MVNILHLRNTRVRLDGLVALRLLAGMPTVSAIYRYPVKGLSAEPLTSVNLAAGETIPFDRA